MFDAIAPFAALMRETSCISKGNGKLVCHAKDPISSGLSMDGFLGVDHFVRTRADVFLIRAGGSPIALTRHLMRQSRGAVVPRRIAVSNRRQYRLGDIAKVQSPIDMSVMLDYVLPPRSTQNDEVLPSLRPGSLVINATGLGKDAPGSLLSDAATFPPAPRECRGRSDRPAASLAISPQTPRWHWPESLPSR